MSVSRKHALVWFCKKSGKMCSTQRQQSIAVGMRWSSEHVDCNALDRLMKYISMHRVVAMKVNVVLLERLSTSALAWSELTKLILCKLS